MTENKRFKLIDGIKKGTHSGIWDNQKQHNQGIGDELWLGEVVGMLNEGVILAEENKELKKENEQLKSELSRYKEVNRLDIWKSSYSSEDALITELQNKCDKKQEHIVVLENKIHRMREAIHKLEWLATHRNGELIRENKQLKQLLREVEHELTSLTGLSCFDKCASQLGYVEVFDKDMWELDYTKLLVKIEKELTE